MTDKKKFKKVFNMISNQKMILLKKINNNTDESQYYKQIQYEKFDKFMENNPDCCAIDPPGRGYDLPLDRFIDRVTGFNTREVIL